MTAAVIRGSVLDHRTGRPVARSRVTLEGASSASTISNASGQFTFPALRPGVYYLSAQRKHYAPARFGSRAGAANGSPIALEDATDFNAELRLRRFGVITGEIRDENGLGLPDVPVYAFQTGKRPRIAGYGATDDRGVYRIPGLAAGKYLVRTAPRVLEDKKGFLPTYFGQTPVASAAKLVTVRLEDEVAGIDVEPLEGRVGSIEVRNPDPQPVNVTLFTDMGRREQRLEPGGSAVFDQLAPSAYDLVAETGSGADTQSFYVRAGLGDRITVSLAPAPAVALRCIAGPGVRWEEGSVSVFVRRPDVTDDANARRARCGESIRLAPGTWELAALPPAHLYVKQISPAQAAEDSVHFTVGPRGRFELTLELSDQPASVRGSVRTPDGQPAVGAPVYIYAADAHVRSRLGGVRLALCDPNGEFRVEGLPPGRYEFLSAFLGDPGELEWPVGRGEIVTLSEGASAKPVLTMAELP